MATAPAAPNRVTTGVVRMSFTKTLFNPDEKGAYGCLILIPKTDTDTINKIKASLERAKTDPKSVAKWGGKWLASMTERDTDAHPEYKGHYFINVNTYTKPGVVDAQLNPILDASEVYSGCYGRVSMSPAAYSQDGNRGLKFYLNNVQKVRDGEPLGGAGFKPEDDFTAVAEDFLS